MMPRQHPLQQAVSPHDALSNHGFFSVSPLDVMRNDAKSVIALMRNYPNPVKAAKKGHFLPKFGQEAF